MFTKWSNFQGQRNKGLRGKGKGTVLPLTPRPLCPSAPWLGGMRSLATNCVRQRREFNAVASGGAATGDGGAAIVGGIAAADTADVDSRRIDVGGCGMGRGVHICIGCGSFETTYVAFQMSSLGSGG
jgi:hypothetical protein